MSVDALCQVIESAFHDVQHPGVGHLTNGGSRPEPIEVERVFSRFLDWRRVDSETLDTAPLGLGSALSFFTPEGFRFFIPRYMIADLRDELSFVDPSFFLGIEVLKPRDCIDEETIDALFARFPNEVGRRCRNFTTSQCLAIASYLDFVSQRSDDSGAMEAAKLYRQIANVRG